VREFGEMGIHHVTSNEIFTRIVEGSWESLATRKSHSLTVSDFNQLLRNHGTTIDIMFPGLAYPGKGRKELKSLFKSLLTKYKRRGADESFWAITTMSNLKPVQRSSEICNIIDIPLCPLSANHSNGNIINLLILTSPQETLHGSFNEHIETILNVLTLRTFGGFTTNKPTSLKPGEEWR
jgi:hypothetical protein